MDSTFEAEQLKKGEKLFRQESDFVAGVDKPSRMPPPTLGEIAFAGRSNVGKSSLINALTGRVGLARSSTTPGRTQQINFFNLGETMFLVDLPGYGFAAASKKKVRAWNQMVVDYLCKRQTLKKICLLIDSRRGLKEIDLEAMDVFDQANVPYVIVLTKTDKLKIAERDVVRLKIVEELKNHPVAIQDVYMTSASKKYGIPELRAILAS